MLRIQCKQRYDTVYGEISQLLKCVGDILCSIDNLIAVGAIDDSQMGAIF